MSEIIIAKGNIKFRQVYTCQKCASQENGETETLEIDAKNLNNWQSKIRMNCRGMPIGWASYYAVKADYFLCPACKS